MKKFFKRLWKVWVFIATFFFYPAGTIIWWISPIYIGPIWGRVFAAYLTCFVILAIRNYIKGTYRG